eukprot:jgi/Bigna1/55007/estExt_Genewise1Plus.C_480036
MSSYPPSSILFRVLAIATIAAEAWALNLEPTIGILAQPRAGLKGSYIAASYIKFVESAGARAVPIQYDLPEADLRKMFQSVNGILFPGGGANLANTTTYAKTSKLFIDLAIQAKNEGDHFPIWATCLGFESLAMIIAEDDSVLCSGCFDTEGIALPLDFTENAASSRMFGQLPKPLFDAISTKNTTENSHRSGVTPDEFGAGTKLGKFFSVLSTNRDSKGHEFVSSIEANSYPIYGTQWHPEKANFEWNSAAIPHLPESILLSQSMANLVVGESRKNDHHFESQQEEDKALIYNYQAIKDPTGYFVQIYKFPPGTANDYEDVAVFSS